MKNISMPIRIITILFLVVYVFSMSVYIAHAYTTPTFENTDIFHWITFKMSTGVNRCFISRNEQLLVYRQTDGISTDIVTNQSKLLYYYDFDVTNNVWVYGGLASEIKLVFNRTFLETNNDILDIQSGSVIFAQNVFPVVVPTPSPTPEPTPTPIITPTPIPSPSVGSVGQIVPIVESSLNNVVFSVSENEKTMLSVELLFITVMCLIYIVRKIFKVFGGA